MEPPLVLDACRRVLAEAGVLMVTGRAWAHLDDDGVRVEVAGEELRPPGLPHARALLGQAARFFPVLAGVAVDRWWLAYRAMPVDRLPIVGSLPWLEGLHLAVSHRGVSLAPVLGRLVAREVADQTRDGLLAPFRPGRFAERATRVMLEVASVFREPPVRTARRGRLRRP